MNGPVNSYPDFVDLKVACNGMLAPLTYQRIYEAAVEAPEGLFIEIGTAHGAATVALALGAIHSGKRAHVHTFDRLEGGSRSRYGSRDENIAIVERHLKRFGVRDRISLHVGDAEHLHRVIPHGSEIALLMLDADGQIDRDLSLFYDRLTPGALVIIDDYENTGKINRLANGVAFIDLKYKITYELLERFVAHGLVEKQRQHNNTIFCMKPRRAPQYAIIDDSVILSAYKTLVHTRGVYPRWRTAMKSRIYNALSEYAPNLLRKIEQRRYGV